MKTIQAECSQGDQVISDDTNPVYSAGVCCSCCGYKTLHKQAEGEICPVCFWQDERGMPVIAIGSHNLVGIAAARLEYDAIGASDLLWVGEVRPPTTSEKRAQGC